MAQIVGRAQARFAPMGGGALMDELMKAPLFAQLRFVGPADTLWRLTGSEVLDMSGPLAVGADIGGSFANPVIRGSLRTQNARLESSVTGMVIDNVVSQARFSGPQLIFSQITGSTAGGGSISGNGSVTFSGGRTALNLSFNANQALLLNRDDVAARVTGPVQIRSDGQGGTISGDFKLNKGALPARPSERRRCRSTAQCARKRPRARGHHRTVEPSSVEAQSEARGQQRSRDGPRHRQPLDDEPASRGLGR